MPSISRTAAGITFRQENSYYAGALVRFCAAEPRSHLLVRRGDARLVVQWRRREARANQQGERMNVIYRMVLAGLAGLALLAGAASDAGAQTIKQRLVGTWSLISIMNTRPDGSKYEAFGPNTKGILMLDRGGRFSLQLMGDARRKFAANNRLDGSPEENKAAVHGTLAYFGTYSVDGKDHVLVFHVERGSFPNWDGMDQRRSIILTGDQLTWKNAGASGGGSGELVWQRAR
jgi:hypothetical protein